MLVGGIDVGKRGGIAFIDVRSMVAEVFSMPENFEGVIEIFLERKDRVVLVGIEKQQAFPKQGVVSMFTLGWEYGKFIGMFKALKIPFEEISPRSWQKSLGLSCKRNKRNRKELKEASIEKARNLFPYLDIGKHDGKADALLIAEYVRRFLLHA